MVTKLFLKTDITNENIFNDDVIGDQKVVTFNSMCSWKIVLIFFLIGKNDSANLILAEGQWIFESLKFCQNFRNVLFSRLGFNPSSLKQSAKGQETIFEAKDVFASHNKSLGASWVRNYWIEFWLQKIWQLLNFGTLTSNPNLLKTISVELRNTQIQAFYIV